MIYLRNKVYTGYKIIDDSSIKYYLKEIVLTLLSLFLIYSIFSYGRNYVITNSPSYVLYNNWHINLPKGTEVLTQYKYTNWFGEGTKVYVIRVDKQETTDTFFDLKNYYNNIDDEYKLYLTNLISQITDMDIKTALSDANAKYKILTAQRKAWDGGPEDSRRLYSLYDEKTGLFYVVEELL